MVKKYSIQQKSQSISAAN